LLMNGVRTTLFTVMKPFLQKLPSTLEVDWPTASDRSWITELWKVCCIHQHPIILGLSLKILLITPLKSTLTPSIPV
uniref:NR LBD domain-containing protein n=1 Tax=Haemonchus placei TaxID=6290 RepID=A0A0N4WFH7_HAEPC